MHMMSKKDLSSDALDTLRRSRTPTVVLTANGEVHTNEEAQVYVHDLNLLVTVQFMEETPGVLSLGKLCEKTTVGQRRQRRLAFLFLTLGHCSSLNNFGPESEVSSSHRLMSMQSYRSLQS